MEKRRKKLLIIEDEIEIAELEKDYLEMEGYVVDIKENGESGLQAALSKNYDLILLDLMLPDVDGFEVCREIRKEKEIPILMISARKEDVDKIRGFGEGADDYMTKPFSPGEMVARVRAHIERYNRLVKGEGKTGKFVEIRGLKIDKRARKVFVNGEEKNLASREYAVLLFLAEHPNKVYSKEELFREVWGMDSMGDIATVTVHIRKIREKIEYDTSNPQYIETMWGAGYRFRV